MRRVLIITYYWPPSGGAGVQRWLKFVKYLPGQAWEPVVYTAQNAEYPETDLSLLNDIPAGLQLIRTPIWEPYQVYKRFIGQGKGEKISAGFLSEKKKPGLAEALSVWIRGNFFIPDARKFWIKPSVKYLARYLKDHPVDAIISTGPPHSCHLIGLGLKKLTGLPWIADFRDPWTQIDFYDQLRLSAWADKKHKKMEKEVLRQADRVIMISPSQAALFREIYLRQYEVITNGFDLEDYQLHDKQVLDKKFSLAHIGSLVPSRNPAGLWAALQALLKEESGLRECLEIKLVGKVDYSVIESLRAAGLDNLLTKIDYLPHDEVVKAQFSSRVLLLLINQTPNAKSILTGKFFEYLATGRPILCIGPPDGDAATILSKCSAGFTADYQDINAMKQIIRQYFLDFKRQETPVEGQAEDAREASGGALAYSRETLTASLAVLLNDLLAGLPGHKDAGI